MYLRRGSLKEARALTINGSFVHQCIVLSIEYVRDLCSSGASTEYIMDKLKHCTEGFYATATAERMESYIQRYLPPDNQQSMSMATFANLSTKSDVMGYVSDISSDFYSTKKSQKVTKSGDDMGAQLKLVFKEDNGTEGGTQEVLDVRSMTTLKCVFTDYAERRKSSLRSLRFSFSGQALFLSQAGKMTPGELGMKDQDMILVTDIRALQEKNDVSSKKTPKSSLAKQQYTNSGSKKTRKQGKSKPSAQYQPTNDGLLQEELKIEVCYHHMRNLVLKPFDLTYKCIFPPFLDDSIQKRLQRFMRSCNQRSRKLDVV